MISLRKSRKSVVEKCQGWSQSSVAEMQKGLGNKKKKKETGEKNSTSTASIRQQLRLIRKTLDGLLASELQVNSVNVRNSSHHQRCAVSDIDGSV